MALLRRQAQKYPSELHIACTKSREVRCQLLEHRDAINKMLLEIGLEIQEDHRVDGGVRMAATQIPWCVNVRWKPETWLQRPSTHFIYDLITNHQCLSALEIYSSIPWPMRVRRALERCSTVKSLTILVEARLTFDEPCPEDGLVLPSCLTSLEELRFKDAVPPHMSYFASRPVKGHLSYHTLGHLTTLDVIAADFDVRLADTFFRALADSRSVTDFAVNWPFLRMGLTSHAELLCLYLPSRLAIMKKLTVTDGDDICNDQDLWLRLTEAFAQKATLEELCVDMKIEAEIYPAVSVGFAEIVRRCTNIRRLHLPAPSREHWSLWSIYEDWWPESLIDALKCTRELRDLYISVAEMGQTQLHSLFAALESNESLKNVIVWNGLYKTCDDILDMALLSGLTRERNVGDRISLSQELFIWKENALKLVELLSLHSLKFLQVRVQLCYPCPSSILDCCKILCRRGSQVTFEVPCIDTGGPTLGNLPDLLTWLGESPALTHVTVFVHCNFCNDCGDLFDSVVSALAKNSSIVKLELIQLHLHTGHLDALCQSAREYRSLAEVILTPTYTRVDGDRLHRFNRPSKKFRDAALKLLDTVRRNASRMRAAVKYVLGDITAEGASAVEELLLHPRLLERVREDGEVTDAKAEAMVKLAVSRVGSSKHFGADGHRQ